VQLRSILIVYNGNNMSSGNTSSQRVAKALELNAKEDKQPEPLLIFIVVCLF